VLSIVVLVIELSWFALIGYAVYLLLH